MTISHGKLDRAYQDTCTNYSPDKTRPSGCSSHKLGELYACLNLIGDKPGATSGCFSCRNRSDAGNISSESDAIRKVISEQELSEDTRTIVGMLTSTIGKSDVFPGRPAKFIAERLLRVSGELAALSEVVSSHVFPDYSNELSLVSSKGEATPENLTLAWMGTYDVVLKEKAYKALVKLFEKRGRREAAELTTLIDSWLGDADIRVPGKAYHHLVAILSKD